MLKLCKNKLRRRGKGELSVAVLGCAAICMQADGPQDFWKHPQSKGEGVEEETKPWQLCKVPRRRGDSCGCEGLRSLLSLGSDLLEWWDLNGGNQPDYIRWVRFLYLFTYYLEGKTVPTAIAVGLKWNSVLYTQALQHGMFSGTIFMSYGILYFLKSIQNLFLQVEINLSI